LYADVGAERQYQRRRNRNVSFAKAYNRSPRKFCKDLIRTYAVGGLSTWQSGTFHFRRVRLFRAERGTIAPNKIGKYHAAAGKKPPIVLPNNAPA
jgi:hypothetical protein